ncbi:hypothetical protein Plut_1511 [Pelodictyon luteolum DSM 273]|uniref:Uncharacterized protein n=1 Tax=Chlorobium luteolum (strain DSM 273 / BCRC 81028 / 2530) TaxID=319225 RepID=Q3B2R3_CHLL3|nr:hypothetical protein Plut_1511 [Pelodictyon luteolum DSM 273]
MEQDRLTMDPAVYDEGRFCMGKWGFSGVGTAIASIIMKLLTPVGWSRCNGGHLFEKKRLKGRFFFIPLKCLLSFGYGTGSSHNGSGSVR